MKNILAIALLSALSCATAAAEPIAKPAPGGNSTAQPQGRFQGALFDALRNLSAMLPKRHGNTDPRQVIALGIREKRSPSSEISLYEDPADTLDRLFDERDYSAAQELLEAGRLKEAEAAFTGFIQTHPASDLLSNARFGLALALAAQGDGKGKEAMETFARDYPQHPLAADALKVAAELK